MISNVARRSFHVRVPMIKFLGKRSLIQKVAAVVKPAQGMVKALSVGATTEFADFPAARWGRLAFTQEEIDTINQGTNEIAMDWNKVKL